MSQPRPDTALRTARNLSMEELFELIEVFTGLEVSIYPAPGIASILSIDNLPLEYRRHMSAFCRTVKRNRKGVGCMNHDAGETNRKAGLFKKPFVQTCHAGVAEVIVPIMGAGTHLATVFIGQVITDTLAAGGFQQVLSRVKHLGVDQKKLKKAYQELPRLPEQRLLQIGMLIDAALGGMAQSIGVEAFTQEVLMQNCPPIRKAIAIVGQEGCLKISEEELAGRVFLTPAYFSRLFRKITGTTFVQYMTERRMEHATMLLHTTDLPIAEIACVCGYSRQSYFTSRFKEVTGMTPTQYRNDSRNYCK